MTNLQKRILTSILILPISIYFLISGGYQLIFFLIFIFFLGLYELFNVFKKTNTKLFLFSILTLSFCSIYFLSKETTVSKYLLYFAVAICISSDIGGYIFGKLFKWKKLTKISPNKTISGVFGSYFFSFICLAAFNEYLLNPISTKINVSFLTGINEILLTIILSTVSQAGDITISYLKRLDKIKDSGKILPGHGGIFDRIDGLMFVIILTLLLYQMRFLFL